MNIKFINKNLLSIMLVSILTLSAAVSVQAKENVATKTITNPSYSNILTDKNIISKFPNMKNKDFKSKNLIGGKELYINFVKTLDSKTGNVISSTSKVSTKEAYQESLVTDLLNKGSMTTNSINASVPIQNSWMRLTFNTYSNNNIDLDIYGYYEWLKNPFFNGYDVLGLAHDSHMTFNYASAWADNCWTDSGFATGIPFSEHWTHSTNASSNFKGDIGGVAFTNKLTGRNGTLDDGTVVYPYGMMYVSAKKGNTSDTSSEIGLSYGHQEYGLQIVPTVTIPLGYTIRITGAYTYDIYNLPYQLNY